MGSREESAPAKPPKSAAATQESPTTPSYPDWAKSMQAQGMIATTTETERKPPDATDRGSVKKSRGGKSGDGGKTSSGSANDGASQSDESRSEGSSDGSDENMSQQESPATRRRSFDEMLADGAIAQHNNATQYSIAAIESSFSNRGQPATKLPISARRKSAITAPATNLSIGMDHWNSSAAGPAPIKARPIAAVASPGVLPTGMIGPEGFMPENQWMDERELKKWKRKQSNRESARRSRLRKQAECEELAARVHTLNEENQTLKNEIQRLSGECDKLTSENVTIKERLAQLYGPEVVSMLELFIDTKSSQSVDGEGNGQARNTSNGISSSVPGQENDMAHNSNGKHESDS
ncbi:G-box-binding factor 1-like isoform X2 [Magnolia sinica]|uniref:G-box-binding factor 1-like isoform X2 n=1 Tax=Magnolia sinica TaxID=86752 RepID=UPI00265A5903|nr:G-box-binding factor 1-like isoform X2 [Magnolia sinica]